jgi:hypothetical protein
VGARRVQRAVGIDLGVLGPAPLDPAVLAAVREACDALPTLRSIDLVDLADAPGGLREGTLAGDVVVEAG